MMAETGLIKEYASESAARKSAAKDAADETEYPPLARRGWRLKDLPHDEMPREKLSELGPNGLTDAELVAILLGSGTQKMNVKDLAIDLLRESDGLEALSKSTHTAMMNYSGVGLAKASKLVAAFEIGRRVRFRTRSAASAGTGSKPAFDTRMHTPHAVADMMQPLLCDLPHEELWVIYMSAKHRYRGKSRVYQGNLDTIEVRTGVVMSGVVERRVPCFTVVHNHPSGDSEPSTADITTTQKLVRAAKELDIEMVDHVIVGSRGYTSLRNSRLVLFD